jgi:hypothetical protein
MDPPSFERIYHIQSPRFIDARRIPMANTPQQEFKDKGFWDGGASGHGTNKESSGRPDGFPGSRARNRIGVRTDIEEFSTIPTSDTPTE